MSRAIFFSLLVSVSILFLSAQENEWGIGLIMPAGNQVFSLRIYDSPDHDEIDGLVLREEPYQALMWKNAETDVREQLSHAGTIEFDYEISGLTVYAEQINYYQVFSPDPSQARWVRKRDLLMEGVVYADWMEFMIHYPETLFPGALGINMNVRDKPSVEGKKLLTANSDRFFIEPTGRSQGLWAEVVVSEYSGEYCSGDEILIRQVTGWVKMLDDAGYPNLWYYTRGC